MSVITCSICYVFNCTFNWAILNGLIFTMLMCFSKNTLKFALSPLGILQRSRRSKIRGACCVDALMSRCVLFHSLTPGGGRDKLSMLRYSQTTEAGQANLGESFKIHTINHIPESPLSSLYATLSTHTLESPLSSLYPTLSTHTLESPLSSLYPTLSTHTLESPLSSLYPRLLPLHPSMFFPGNLCHYKSWE